MLCSSQLSSEISTAQLFKFMVSKFCILQVEDDGNDVFFLEHAFRHAGIVDLLHVVRDGHEAIDYIQGTGSFTDRARFPFPCLVLLDLKLPRKDGFEVLRWIRDQPNGRLLTVLVLTSSSRQEEIDRCYSLGANSFIVKPSELQERLELAKLIQAYWLRFHRAPSSCSGGPRLDLATRVKLGFPR